MQQTLQTSAGAESVAEGPGHDHTPPNLRMKGKHSATHQKDPKQGQAICWHDLVSSIVLSLADAVQQALPFLLDHYKAQEEKP